MDLLNLLWNASQESRLRDVPTQVNQMQVDRDLHGWDARHWRPRTTN
jgi:hypothetical protein